MNSSWFCKIIILVEFISIKAVFQQVADKVMTEHAICWTKRKKTLGWQKTVTSLSESVHNSAVSSLLDLIETTMLPLTRVVSPSGVHTQAILCILQTLQLRVEHIDCTVIDWVRMWDKIVHTFFCVLWLISAAVCLVWLFGLFFCFVFGCDSSPQVSSPQSSSP